LCQGHWILKFWIPLKFGACDLIIGINLGGRASLEIRDLNQHYRWSL
jgi:hypothetical protein